MSELEAFRANVEQLKESVWREIFRNNPDLIGVVKEKTAVKRLGTIVDTTVELSNEKGFQAMSLRDLVAKAGISKGGLYAYISNKDDLALLIQKYGYLLAMRILEGGLSSSDTPDQRLVQLIRNYVYLTEVQRPWFRFSYLDARSLGDAGQQEVIDNELRSDALFAQVIREGQASGLFGDVDAELCAAMIKAMLQDRYLKPWKYSRLDVDIERFIELVLGVVGAHLAIDFAR